MSTLTLIQQLLHTSKLLLEEPGYAGTHAAILADAVRQSILRGAREQVPLHAFQLENNTNANKSKPRVQIPLTEFSETGNLASMDSEEYKALSFKMQLTSEGLSINEKPHVQGTTFTTGPTC